MTSTIDTLTDRSITAANSTYKKLAVQWLNQALCFVSRSVVADSLVLRNRQLLVATNRSSSTISKINDPKGYNIPVSTIYSITELEKDDLEQFFKEFSKYLRS